MFIFASGRSLPLAASWPGVGPSRLALLLAIHGFLGATGAARREPRYFSVAVFNLAANDS